VIPLINAKRSRIGVNTKRLSFGMINSLAMPNCVRLCEIAPTMLIPVRLNLGLTSSAKLIKRTDIMPPDRESRIAGLNRVKVTTPPMMDFATATTKADTIFLFQIRYKTTMLESPRRINGSGTALKTRLSTMCITEAVAVKNARKLRLFCVIKKNTCG